jgi:hypothetical protein
MPCSQLLTLQTSLASNTVALFLASSSLLASPPSTKHTSTSTSYSSICKPLAPRPHSHSNSILAIPGSAPIPVHLPLSDSSFYLLASAATNSKAGRWYRGEPRYDQFQQTSPDSECGLRLPSSETSSYSNPHILPLAYSLHTQHPISANCLILSNRLQIFNNTFILLLIQPPPRVCSSGHAETLRPPFWTPIGRGLGFQAGWYHGCFARSGCRPNAILRPLLCDDSNQ